MAVSCISEDENVIQNVYISVFNIVGKERERGGGERDCRQRGGERESKRGGGVEGGGRGVKRGDGERGERSEKGEEGCKYESRNVQTQSIKVAMYACSL